MFHAARARYAPRSNVLIIPITSAAAHIARIKRFAV